MLFDLVMFVLVEVPLVSYVISPDKTADRVSRFQDFLTKNASRIVAVLALGFGIALIAKGIAAWRERRRLGRSRPTAGITAADLAGAVPGITSLGDHPLGREASPSEAKLRGRSGQPEQLDVLADLGY